MPDRIDCVVKIDGCKRKKTIFYVKNAYNMLKEEGNRSIISSLTL
jgi:hypothetical protein